MPCESKCKQVRATRASSVFLLGERKYVLNLRRLQKLLSDAVAVDGAGFTSRRQVRRSTRVNIALTSGAICRRKLELLSTYMSQAVSFTDGNM